MHDLDEETALTVGGWDTRFAVVRVVTTAGEHAAAVVDANGDGADINLEQFRWLDGTWTLQCSSGGAGDDGIGWHDGMFATYGRSEGGWWLTLESSPAPTKDDRSPLRNEFGWFAYTPIE